MVFNRVTDWAVTLFNDRGERPMAHEAFRWVKARAKVVGNHETWELACKNEKAGWR
ncbi:MAG: hypothetical protein JWM10_5285 [Myxococcaceae bacterium]|nr:hypothetical protein [Myxococcaceae bacterium]